MVPLEDYFCGLILNLDPPVGLYRSVSLKHFSLLILTRISFASASELTAAAIILQVGVLFKSSYHGTSDNSGQYWTPKLLSWHWAIIIVVPVFLLQLIHVRIYGQFTLCLADV
jgi:hypothetical protein